MTTQIANVRVTNTANAEADIILIHDPSGYPIEWARWTVAAGATSPSMPVHFNTGLFEFADLDGWAIMLFIRTGHHAGTYWNSKSATVGGWKECQLESADANQTITFTVSTSQFDIALPSGGCTDTMTKVAPAANAAITHVFVVMLENRSFDNMLAMSGVNDITKAQTSNYNSYDGVKYHVTSPAPDSLTNDPGHEFLDVLQQLTGKTSFKSGDTYGPINGANFVTNFATSVTEYPHEPPASSNWGDVMACVETQTQAPVFYTLATQFGICESWFSSLPGPTWPNRFFAHGASSSGMDDSPSQTQIVGWEEALGFKYPNGSIFALLDEHNIAASIVNDDDGMGYSEFSNDPLQGSTFGATPQVWSLSGINSADTANFRDFKEAVRRSYPYGYTFFEPHYGDVGDTYRGGSSQHPMDDLAGGEAYLAAIFNAIQDSPYWNSSLLIVCYDEHGGFYDSATPMTTYAPGDNPTYGYNKHGFDFKTLGVRVPALVISPLIPAWSVASEVYDHSSIPRTLEWLWKLPTLTDRDKNAAVPVSMLVESTPRTDKVTLPSPPPSTFRWPPLTEADRAARRARPMPEQGNLVGTLGTLFKVNAELNLLAPDLATPRPTITTIGDAEDFANQVHAKLRQVRARRREAKEAARAAEALSS